jgi:hypothetical protein
VEVIVMKVKRKEGGAVVTGVIGAGVGPLAGDGLDEAFGLAVGLRAIGFGEAMFEAELLAGGGEEFGAVSGAAVGEDALDDDAVLLVEGDGLVKGGEDTGSLFIWKEGGEGETGMVVDGDVQAFDAGTRVALGAITGGTDAWACETAQLLDVKVEKVAGRVAFVADGRRLWRLQGGETIQAVPAKHAAEGGRRDGEDHADLSVRTALAAQGEDVGFEFRGGFAGLMKRSRGLVVEPLWKAGEFGACEPAADSLFADAEGGGGVAQRAAGSGVTQRHLGSRQGSERGISVHVVRAGGREVVCSSTTSLPDPFRADNLLKHDT